MCLNNDRSLPPDNYMNYVIHTPSATRLKQEITKCISEKIDANGNGIATWQCVETGGSDKVFVHTKDQWAEKGCIALYQNARRNELQVHFCYWDSWKERGLTDDKIMFGRFTELILVHFSYLVDKIIIE